MDPLTALSLAGNIIQFVDFGSRFFSRAGELYKSSVGSLAVNDEIKLVTTDLKVLINALRESFVPWHIGKVPTQQDQDNSESFREVCDEAARVAEEILGRLSKMKLNGKHGKLRSLQQAVKTLWNEDEISGLMKRLSTLKENLESHVLFSIRKNLDAESIRTSTRFDNLDRQTQQILNSMLEANANTDKNISQEFRDGMEGLTITISQLLSRIEHMNQESHRKIREKILEGVCERKGQLPSEHQIIAGVEMLDVSDVSEQQLRASLPDGIINSLRYSSMTYRYEDVVEAHPNTFKWIFKNSTEIRLPWSNLSDWFKTGDGLYWVCGKAGSGKSTLMKYIYDEERTRQLLKVWAGTDLLCIATFFFWSGGTREQRSQIGCLRSLLFQVLNQNPQLVPLVLPKIWAKFYSKAVRQDPTLGDLKDSWTLRQLMDAMRALIHQKSVLLKICFLIDGLDEFDGDHEEMGKLFQEIATSKNVKVCVSSRPWVVFQTLFDSSPMLRMQNLTCRDIEQYVGDRLRLNNAYQKLADREPDTAEALVYEIIDKADGVFLWVKLVVDSLLNGIRNRDEMSDLWERLRLMPRELEPLYSRLLELIEPNYLPWVSKAFQILRANRNQIYSPFKTPLPEPLRCLPLTLSAFFLAIYEDIDVAMLQGNAGTALQKKCEDTLVQLTARCAGFLEISSTDGNISGDSAVQYFHKTARDFLETEESWSKILLQTSNTNFDPNTAMMRSCVITLQLNPILLEAQISMDDRKSIIRILQDCMIYALHADAHFESHGVQFALLDQLMNMLTSRGSRLGQYDSSGLLMWVIDMLPYTEGSNNFLELATLYDLKSYVREGITRLEKSQVQTVATTLLHYLLPSRDCHVYNGLPLPGIEMVRFLLDMGADPNLAWKRVLTYQANIVYSSSCSSLRDLNYDPQVFQRRYIEIMFLLLLSGVNPEMRVVDYRRAQHTAIEVVEEILMSRFPQEAAPLLKDLQERVRLKSRSKSKDHKIGFRTIMKKAHAHSKSFKKEPD